MKKQLVFRPRHDGAVAKLIGWLGRFLRHPQPHCSFRRGAAATLLRMM